MVKMIIKSEVSCSELVLSNQCNSIKKLAIIVLCKNEEIHIARCLASIHGLAAQVMVVDCGSEDRTVEVAESLGATVFHNRWKNYATQFNWALTQLAPDIEWVLRLDADEIVDETLKKSLASRLSRVRSHESGFTVDRYMIFQGRLMRWGGVFPARMVRVFRRGHGRCEERWMDEHIVVAGRIGHLDGKLTDWNLNGLDWWLSKHNSYASREAVDILLRKYGMSGSGSSSQTAFGHRAKLKRLIKENFYLSLPRSFRSFIYFIIRYFLLGGFLDGSSGFSFHFLQGFWYRFIVDLKVSEVELCMRKDSLCLSEAVSKTLKIHI